MTDIKAIDKKYVANTYARFPVQLVSGKGALAWERTERIYRHGHRHRRDNLGFADEA